MNAFVEPARRTLSRRPAHPMEPAASSREMRSIPSGRRAFILTSRSLAVALCLLGSACATPGPVSTAASPGLDGGDLRSLLPLAVGNEWRFRTIGDDRGGQVVVRIEKEEGGFHVDNLGGAFRFDAEGLRDRERYLVLLPLEEGHRWESRLEGGVVERYEIVDVEATVEVPAGTFRRAVVVRATTRLDDSTEMEREWTWARGVGPVRTTATVIRRGERFPQPGLELEAFVPAKGEGAVPQR
ncbi:MAG TPA: hypothetical protein VGD74_10800 [Vulgatibacter sp.]